MNGEAYPLRGFWPVVWACCLLGAATVAAQDSPGPPLSTRALVVGTKQAAPFAMRQADGTWRGIGIDLWQAIADKLDLTYELRERDLQGLLDGVQDGSLAAAVAAITITAAREQRMDFTHTFYSTGLSVAVQTYGGNTGLRVVQRLLSWDFLQVFGLFVLVLAGVGALVWLCERRRNPQQFSRRAVPGIGAGFWWAAVTMTTVGYGDKAPVTVLGRGLALIWMVVTLMLLASFIAAITSALTVTKLATRIDRPEDLIRRRIATVSGSTSEGYLRRQGITARAFATPQAALQAVANRKNRTIDAMVYDAPLLLYLARTQFQGAIAVLPITLERQDYGIALPPGSPLRESINRALIEIIHQPTWQGILDRYLGQ